MIQIKDRCFDNLEEALKQIPVDNRENIDIVIDGEIHGQYTIQCSNITIHNGTFINDFGAYEVLEDGFKRGTFRSYTLYIEGDNVTLDHVKILNTAGSERGQAIALMVDGDNFVMKDCLLSSYQDTLFLGPLPQKEFEPGGFNGPMKDKPRITKHFHIMDSVIEGSVDYVFGGGRGLFERCIFRSLKEGYVFAPSTDKIEKYGFIAKDCQFVSDIDQECVYLARPWRNYAKLLLIGCIFGRHICKEGYTDWNKDMSTVEFKEDGDILERKYAIEISSEDLKEIEKYKRRD